MSQMHPKPYILSILRTHRNRNKNAFLAEDNARLQMRINNEKGGKTLAEMISLITLGCEFFVKVLNVDPKSMHNYKDFKLDTTHLMFYTCMRYVLYFHLVKSS